MDASIPIYVRQLAYLDENDPEPTDEELGWTDEPFDPACEDEQTRQEN